MNTQGIEQAFSFPDCFWKIFVKKYLYLGVLLSLQKLNNLFVFILLICPRDVRRFPICFGFFFYRLCRCRKQKIILVGLTFATFQSRHSIFEDKLVFLRKVCLLVLILKYMYKFRPR